MEIYCEDEKAGPTWHQNKFSNSLPYPEQEDLEQLFEMWTNNLINKCLSDFFGGLPVCQSNTNLVLECTAQMQLGDKLSKKCKRMEIHLE